MPESTFVIERHLFRVGVGRSDSSDVRDSSPAAYAPPMPSQRSQAQLTPSAAVTQTAPAPALIEVRHGPPAIGVLSVIRIGSSVDTPVHRKTEPLGQSEDQAVA